MEGPRGLSIYQSDKEFSDEKGTKVMKSSVIAVLCGLGHKAGDVIPEPGSLAEAGQKDPLIMQGLTVQSR